MIENKKSEKANLENKKSLFFLIGLVLALSLVLYAFEWETQKTEAVKDFGNTGFISEDFIFIPSTPAEKKELPKPMVKVQLFDIVDNETTVDENIDVFSSEPEDFVNIDFTNLIFQPNEDDYNTEEIFIVAEIMPEFPGGERALINYLTMNIKYPLIAQENGIEGKVYVSFVIDENGNIYNVSLLRGVDTSLDNEALRVVKGMPNWKPGRQAGKAVKVRYSVPIYFDLK
ncbi:TonB family protein [Prolixibacteraceae bacterium Z1-6]|uniref:TonB family protein n=1 Tax=Draconibacterium aestuarii TaxID=2998507 RepID=A0A9X3FAC6_9BACT|nr:TonB family protein [Prolixibacteraceae bacterium Z1-6]